LSDVPRFVVRSARYGQQLYRIRSPSIQTEAADVCSSHIATTSCSQEARGLDKTRDAEDDTTIFLCAQPFCNAKNNLPFMSTNIFFLSTKLQAKYFMSLKALHCHLNFELVVSSPVYSLQATLHSTASFEAQPVARLRPQTHVTTLR
jgi:hypothetical protein